MEAAEELEAVPSRTVIEAMEKIRSTAARVTKITLGLRKFAREAHSDPVTEALVSEIVDDTLSFCTQRLKQHSVDLRLQPIPANLRIGCRPTEIAQVLLNLLNNAVDAVQELPEKWIELSVQDEGGDLEISVTDSGTGIPERVREKMGQPFFTTKEVGQGTGLGLSISQGIVKAHGGKLTLDSECRNTRFVISLPKSVVMSKEAALASR
jgi:C4-dicarboxylate-specific signal transduction histidine kinase